MSTSHVPGSSLPLHKVEQVEGILLTLRTLEESQHRRKEKAGGARKGGPAAAALTPLPRPPSAAQECAGPSGKDTKENGKKGEDFHFATIDKVRDRGKAGLQPRWGCALK